MENEITKGKKKKTGKKPRERIVYHVNAGHIDDYAAPGHALSEGYTDAMNQPDGCKSARDMAASATAGRAGAPVSAAGFDAQRTAGGGGRVAVGAPDLRQSSTDVSEVLATLRTARGNVQDIGFGPDSAVPGGFSHAGSVALRLFDAAGSAGSFYGLPPVSGDPARPASHQVPTGSGSNGSHSSGSQQGACSAPRDSMKATKLDIMKATQRIIT